MRSCAQFSVVVSQYPRALSDWLLRRGTWNPLLLSLEEDTAPSDVLIWATSWVTFEIQSLWAQVQPLPYYKVTSGAKTKFSHHMSRAGKHQSASV